MKKTLIFLLTLTLSLSGTNSNKLDTTLQHIINDLDQLNETTFNLHVNDTIHRRNWTCNTTTGILEELSVLLHKVNTDELSQRITLSTIKEDLKKIKSIFLKGQTLKGESSVDADQAVTL